MKGVSCGWRFPHPSSHPLRLQYHRALVRFPFNRNPHKNRNGRKEKDIPCNFISVKLKKKSRPSKNLCTSSSSGWRTFFPRLLLLWPLLLFGGKQDASGVAGPPRDGALFFDTLLPKEKNSWLDFKCAFDREKTPQCGREILRQIRPIGCLCGGSGRNHKMPTVTLPHV